MTKICTKCLKEKTLSSFSVHKHTLDGLNTQCKECMNEYSRLHYLKNKEKHKEKNRIWRIKNKDKWNEYARIYRQNPDNKDKIYIKNKMWYKNNPDKVRTIAARKRLKRQVNPHWRIRHNLSTMIYKRLKKRLSQKKKSILNYLPYSIDELKQHLENKFQPGMSWDNYGVNGWHIDHIKPDLLFNYNSMEDKEFQECWSLNNLQPLWSEENLKKGSSYPLDKFLI